MTTKFTTRQEAVAAAKAHNIALVGGETGGGYIINAVKGYYDGFTYVQGWYEALAKYEGGEHRVRAI